MSDLTPQATQRRTGRGRMAMAGAALAAILAGGMFATLLTGRDDPQRLVAGSSPTPTAATPTAQMEESATPSPSATPAVTPTQATPPAAPSAPAAGGALVAGGFAQVTADRVNVRVAPAKDAAPVWIGSADAEASAARIGRATPWQDVYLLDGPVQADGFTWYRIGTETSGSLYPEVVGWIAAGDASGAWLVPVERCPDPPFELADVMYVAAPWGMRLGCFAGQELTLQGWFPDPPADAETSGDCVSEPAWLVCGFGYYDLRIAEMAYSGPESANRLEFKIDPSLGLAIPDRGQWIEVSGRFDHPAAENCPEDLTLLYCRLEFVVTSIRPIGG